MEISKHLALKMEQEHSLLEEPFAARFEDITLHLKKVSTGRLILM